jgi:hypothetical protein
MSMNNMTTEQRDYNIVDPFVRQQYAGILKNLNVVRFAMAQIATEIAEVEQYLDILAKHEYDQAKEKKDLEELK